MSKKELEEVRAKERAYYQKNRKRILENSRKRRLGKGILQTKGTLAKYTPEEMKERRKAQKKKWVDKNSKKYYEENRETILKKAKEYYHKRKRK